MLGDLFREAKVSPINYQGNLVYLSDKIVIPKECRLIVEFESANSEWRQGLFFGDMTRRASKVQQTLMLTVMGRTAPGIFLWQDTAPPLIEIFAKAPNEVIFVYNTWDLGNGQSTSLVNGAGMLIEELEDGIRRYRCNDGHPEPTFTNLIFSIKIA